MFEFMFELDLRSSVITINLYQKKGLIRKFFSLNSLITLKINRKRSTWHINSRNDS